MAYPFFEDTWEKDNPEIKFMRDVSASLDIDKKSGHGLRGFILKALKNYPRNCGCIQKRVESYLQKHPEAIEPRFAYAFGIQSTSPLAR